MSKDKIRLDRQTLDILFAVMEAPQPTLSAATLRTIPPHVAAQLFASRVFKPDGYEPVIVSDEDRLVTLTWSQNDQLFGYFEPAKGWVPVPDVAIARYRVDATALLSALTMRLQFLPRATMSELVPDVLWEIGKVRFGNRPPTSVLFGRRLFDERRWRLAKYALQARPTQGRRVLLTSTDGGSLPEAPVGLLLLPLTPIVGDDLALDPFAISGRLDGTPVVDFDDPLVIMAGGKEVRFYGEAFRFPKGVEQRRIIGYLHQCYQLGELWISTDKIITELNLPDGSRIRDYFRGNPAWNKLLTVRKGMCGFCWRDIEKNDANC